MGLLADIFSTGNTLKRRVRGLLDDPVGYVQQIGGLLADNAKESARKDEEAFASGADAMAQRGLAALNGQGIGFAPLGMVSKAPRAEAMRIAQHNAAKPVSEGGLGLHADNTPMDRAKAMGFDADVLHGTTNDFDKFTGQAATYATQDPIIADIYANATGRHQALREINAGPNVMPLKIRGKQLEVSDLGEGGGGWLTDNLANALGVPKKRRQVNSLPDHGYDYLKATNMSDLGGEQTQFMIPSGSSNIRSRFAAFDPARRHEADLLGQVNPELLPYLIGTGLLGSYGVSQLE